MDEVKAPRPLESDEQTELCTLLESQLNFSGENADDAQDVLSYILELSEDNNVGYVIDQVRDLGFDEICTEESLEGVREVLSMYLVQMASGGDDKDATPPRDNKKSTSGGGGGDSRRNNNKAFNTEVKTVPKVDINKQMSGSRLLGSGNQKDDPAVKKSSWSQRQPQQRKLTYSEEVQAREKERGEQVLKNSAEIQASIGMRSGSTQLPPPSDLTAATYKKNTNGRCMSFSEEVQQREKDRGEEVLKNSASTYFRRTSSSDSSSGVVEANGKGHGTYSELLQQREKERGEEVIKNSASTSLRRSTGSSGVVEANGKGQGTYSELLQQREKERGEEVIKNSSSTSLRRSTGSSGVVEAFGQGGNTYSEKLQAEEMKRGEQIFGSSAQSPTGTSKRSNRQVVVEPQHSKRFDRAGTGTTAHKSIDEQRRDALRAVMSNKSLSRDQRRLQMQQVNDRFAALDEEKQKRQDREEGIPVKKSLDRQRLVVKKKLSHTVDPTAFAITTNGLYGTMRNQKKSVRSEYAGRF